MSLSVLESYLLLMTDSRSRHIKDSSILFSFRYVSPRYQLTSGCEGLSFWKSSNGSKASLYCSNHKRERPRKKDPSWIRSRFPVCDKYSKQVHDYYFRTITDLPVFQNRTVILLRTRKFRCGNYQSNRKVFSEQTPDIIRYSRRTERVTSIMETFAI